MVYYDGLVCEEIWWSDGPMSPKNVAHFVRTCRKLGIKFTVCIYRCVDRQLSNTLQPQQDARVILEGLYFDTFYNIAAKIPWERVNNNSRLTITLKNFQDIHLQRNFRRQVKRIEKMLKTS
jgi:hypothetical protein